MPGKLTTSPCGSRPATLVGPGVHQPPPLGEEIAAPIAFQDLVADRMRQRHLARLVGKFGFSETQLENVDLNPCTVRSSRPRRFKVYNSKSRGPTCTHRTTAIHPPETIRAVPANDGKRARRLVPVANAERPVSDLKAVSCTRGSSTETFEAGP
jgi:hypothetical protein